MKRCKRGSLVIMESILRSLKEGPRLKTHIAYKSRLDSRTIAKYHPLLVKMNLVIQKSSGEY
ncbi:MAG: winged helix-turn-helix domain-containing protein [Nitrososphaerales archaeon]